VLQDRFVPRATSPRWVNLLLARLPRADRERMLARAEPVELAVGDVLCEAGRAYRHVYFPLRGIVSLVAAVRGHAPLEVALIGREGVLGATLALGVAGAPLRGVVQGPGSAWRIATSSFRRELRESGALRRLLCRHLHRTMQQMSQMAACTCFHEIGPRLACRLLMTHDRAHADQFHLTHRQLGDMLGVQRSAITIAAGALQRRTLIRYSRGAISILDRRGLERASCGCHVRLMAEVAARGE
jgi:CRP-like cAMP-binding protein